MDEHPLRRHTIATPWGNAQYLMAVAGRVLRSGAGVATVVAAVLSVTTQASVVLAQSRGPAHGTLVISGGAETSSEIYDRFIALAGGPDALIIVVPTSGNGDRFDDSCDCLQLLRKAGARNLQLLHTRDRAVANSEAFVAPLKRAKAAWFAEGNSWKHADAYLDTRVQRELVALLERGGVVGGGSAGARIQSDYMPLRGSEPADRTLPEKDRRRGFGLVKNVIIDPHVLARNRQFDMIGLVNAHPEMIGIGIDENTALVVSGDDIEVIGSSYALIYDNTHQVAPDATGPNGTPSGLFYFLRRGDRFNLSTRESLRPSTGRPISGVISKSWAPR